MNRLYSRTSLIVKAVCCALLPLLTLLVASLCSVSDSFLYVILSLMPLGVLYTIPFRMSASMIRKTRVSGIGKYISLDALCCLVPVVLSSVLSETVICIVTGDKTALGVMTLAITIICILISGIFWLFYYICSDKKKRG